MLGKINHCIPEHLIHQNNLKPWNELEHQSIVECRIEVNKILLDENQ